MIMYMRKVFERTENYVPRWRVSCLQSPITMSIDGRYLRNQLKLSNLNEHYLYNRIIIHKYIQWFLKWWTSASATFFSYWQHRRAGSLHTISNTYVCCTKQFLFNGRPTGNIHQQSTSVPWWCWCSFCCSLTVCEFMRHKRF